MTIVEFLTARLDEWEHALRDEEEMFGSRLIIRRLRDDIAAKRAIIHQHGIGDGAHECPDGFMDSAETEPHTGWEVVCMTQRHLASIYSEHPDYDQSWKP
jgi:hypothetical protein